MGPFFYMRNISMLSMAKKSRPTLMASVQLPSNNFKYCFHLLYHHVMYESPATFHVQVHLFNYC